MKLYEVTTLENWDVEVHYQVEAKSKEEAQELVEQGDGEYVSHECRDVDPEMIVEKVEIINQ